MADAPKSFHLGAEIHAYIVAHGTPPDAIQQELIEETGKLGGISLMQIAPEQGAFMTLLARAIGARRAIEVGTFTGYSSLCIARGLPDDGQLIACDVSDGLDGHRAPLLGEGRRRARRSTCASDRRPRRCARCPRIPSSTSPSSTPTRPSYLVYYELILARLRTGRRDPRRQRALDGAAS